MDIWNTTGVAPGGQATLLEESYLVGEGKLAANEAGEGGYGIAVNGLAGKVFVTDMHNKDVDILSFPILPGVTGVRESNVLTTSATLSGEVNPVGRDANTVVFEYGTTSAYGSTVAATPSDAGSGTSPVLVNASLTGLLPNTLYHYRLVVSNENGTVRSADRVLRTQLVGVTVNDKPEFPSEIGQFSVRLNGTVNPGGGVASYHFLYGPTSSYGSSIPVPEGFTPVNYADDPVSEQVAGLSAGTTYHYELQATNGGGTVTGPDQTFTTLPVPAPVVSTGGASGVTRGEALLSGTIDPRGWSTSYLFEYGTSTAYGQNWPTIDVSLGVFEGAQPVSVTLPNLQPGTTYHYRLRATNGGDTSYGADMTFTTATYPVSVIQEAPVLTVPLGFFNPKPAKTRTSKKPRSRARARRKPPRSRRARRRARRRALTGRSDEMLGRGEAPSVQAAPSGIVGDGNGLTTRGLGPEHVLEIQRARIVAAMVEECAERGAANVSVAHVVSHAGVSRRTFYEVFSDREDCFLGAFDEGIARASRYVLEGYVPSAGWAGRLRVALAGLLSFLDVERGRGQLLVVGSLGAGARALERRQRVLSQMIAVVDEGRQEIKTGDELPPLTAEGIVGGVLSVLHSRLLEDKPRRLVELTGPLMSMIVLPYLGAAAARRELARPSRPRLVVQLWPAPILCVSLGCASPIARCASCWPSLPSPAVPTARWRTAPGSAIKGRSPSCSHVFMDWD